MTFSSIINSPEAKSFSYLDDAVQLQIGRSLGLLKVWEVRFPFPHTLKIMLMFSRMGKYGNAAWHCFKEMVRTEYARDRAEAIDRIMQ
jgi:hypothetical protein